MNFQHYIITRFNLKKSEWNTDRNNREVLDENWLKERIHLFVNYCLPSIVGQTNKNFKWLVFFDKTQKSKELLELFHILKPYSFIEIVFVEGYGQFQGDLPRILYNMTPRSTNWVLTTRLDNDDALNKHFISELQKSVDFSYDKKLIHFPNGLYLNLNPSKLAVGYYPFNQFLSLWEKIELDDLETVFSKEHNSWPESYTVLQLNLQDAWLQVNHHRNLVNRFMGTLTYSKRLQAFEILEVNLGRRYDFGVRMISIGNKIKKRWNRLFP